MWYSSLQKNNKQTKIEQTKSKQMTKKERKKKENKENKIEFLNFSESDLLQIMGAPFDIGGGHGSFLKKNKNKKQNLHPLLSQKKKEERKRKTSLWQQRKKFNPTGNPVGGRVSEEKNFTHQWDKKKKKKLHPSVRS